MPNQNGGINSGAGDRNAVNSNDDLMEDYYFLSLDEQGGPRGPAPSEQHSRVGQIDRSQPAVSVQNMSGNNGPGASISRGSDAGGILLIPNEELVEISYDDLLRARERSGRTEAGPLLHSAAPTPTRQESIESETVGSLNEEALSLRMSSGGTVQATPRGQGGQRLNSNGMGMDGVSVAHISPHQFLEGFPGQQPLDAGSTTSMESYTMNNGSGAGSETFQHSLPLASRDSVPSDGCMNESGHLGDPLITTTILNLGSRSSSSMES